MPTRYYDVGATHKRIGFISPLTNNFCAGCNRIRVTATGQLYPCLGGADQVDLRAAVPSNTPDKNLPAAPGQPRHMSMTGG